MDQPAAALALVNTFVEGKPFAKSTNHNFFPVVNIATERQLYVERHAAVLAYARANQLNQVVSSTQLPLSHLR